MSQFVIKALLIFSYMPRATAALLLSYTDDSVVTVRETSAVFRMSWSVSIYHLHVSDLGTFPLFHILIISYFEKSN